MRFFAFSILVVFVLSCRRDQPGIHPTMEALSESVYASGIVKSRNQYQVFSTTSGIIMEVLVSEGDTVQKGSPLVKIRNKTSVLNEINARLAADYANLRVSKDKLDEASMAIELAAMKMKNDSLLFLRQRNLMEQHIGTRIELEQRELNYKNSSNTYKAAILHYQELERQLILNSKQSENSLNISRAISDEYTLRSEVNGKVYRLLKVMGEYITPQNPVAILGDRQDFLVELQVDEYDITKIKVGQRVILGLDSYRGQAFEAEIYKINPMLNERSKSFTIEANFLKAPAKLYPFLTVEANIVIQTKKQALTIPRAYLISDSLVMTENNKLIQVTTGLMDYQKVEIISGLSVDDFIIKKEN